MLPPIVKNQGREVDLDVIRGIAILLAMGWHFNQRSTGYWVVDAILSPGRLFGWAGVDMFFVLSGFLVGRLIMKEYRSTGQFWYSRFFIRRILKIWPILYVFLAFMMFATKGHFYDSIVPIGFHIQNYIKTQVATHLWSLAVEEHFYLVLGLSFAVIVRFVRGPSYIVYGLVALIVLAPIARLIGALNGVDPSSLQLQTQYRIDALALGVLLAWLSVFKPEHMAALLRPKLLWVAVGLIGYAFLSVTPKDTFIGSTLGFTVSYVAGCAVILAVYRSGIDSVFPRSSTLIGKIGLYSYATYIWHVPLAKIWEAAAVHFTHQPLILIAGSYGAALAISPLISRLVEIPSLSLRDRVFPARAHAVG